MLHAFKAIVPAVRHGFAHAVAFWHESREAVACIVECAGDGARVDADSVQAEAVDRLL